MCSWASLHRRLARYVSGIDRNLPNLHALFLSTISPFLIYTPKHKHTLPGFHSLAELLQCQVQLTSESALLKQAVIMASSPTYNETASIIAGLVCLAYNAEIHKYLVAEDLLQRVMKAVKRPFTHQEAHINQYLLRYCIYT